MTRPICAILGAGPGNGAAFARRFSQEGYAVALLARSTEFSQALAAKLEEARSYVCDASDPESVISAFSQIQNEMGDVDTLILNAGGGTWKTVEEITTGEFEQDWRINALGPLVAAQQVMPAMLAKKAGSIVFIGATASLRGRHRTTGFASAKAAQRSLAQSMAKQLWPQGIHVSLIIIDGAIRNEDGLSVIRKGERLEATDIASLAFYLTTQPASCWTFETDARPFREKW